MTKSKWFKPIVFALGMLLLLLQYELWFSPGGLFSILHLKQDIAQQREVNAKLKARNEAIIAQIQSLKNNNEAVEGQAREELGMIKPGEHFYQVINNKKHKEKNNERGTTKK